MADAGQPDRRGQPEGLARQPVRRAATTSPSTLSSATSPTCGTSSTPRTSSGCDVILDWVANHTAWDNALVEQHPEWYARDWKGDFRPTPWWDWDDIIDLDYDHAALRDYMADAMCFWVREAGVDGFRCDVAGFVPVDFWEQVRRDLEQIKPVFMLAEWETRDLHRRAFDASYAWSWNSALHEIAQRQGEPGAAARLLRLERRCPGRGTRCG